MFDRDNVGGLCPHFGNVMFMKNIESDNVYKVLEMLKSEN